MSTNYLNESGLSHFWNNKIKPLIYKKATLQEDLVVKNPRVTVDLPDGHTFTAGSTMEELFRYLYRHVYDEVQPNLPVILPSISLKLTMAKSSVEVGETVNYTVQKDQFNQGKIGSCTEPWEEEPHQSQINSGSTEKSGTLKFYRGNENNPESCNTELTLNDGKYTSNFEISQSGTNNLGLFFCGTVQYNSSSATSKTSYGNTASVTGVSSFGEGTTSRSSCVTGNVKGYYPAFGNISTTATEQSTATISNLGDKFNAVGTTEFYYGPTNTIGDNAVSFEIYFPATLNGSVQYYDTITQAWTTIETSTISKKYATIPAGTDTTKFPNQSLTSGVEYKLIKQAAGGAYGPRKYRLTLENVNA